MRITAVMLVLMILETAAVIIIKTRMRKQSTGWLYQSIPIVLFFIVFAVTARFMLFPPVQELPVTGKYRIGSADYWVDENEADPYLKNGKLRQLQIRKWYPLECKESHPVIISSHGSCGTIDNNLSLYRELASHGYTILAIVHPGQAASITYESGEKAGPSIAYLKQMTSLQPQKDPERSFEIFKEWMSIRTGDLNTVMDDYVIKEGKTDFIVIGHSAGGSAAYAMARIRDDVVGCAAMEAPFLYDILGTEDGDYIFNDENYQIPLLNIYSDSGYPHLRDWKQYKNNVKFLDSNDPKYTNIYYEGTGHMGLCDLSLVSPFLSSFLDGRFPKVNAKEQLIKMNADYLTWLEQFN